MMQANFDHCAALVREADRDRYLSSLYAPAGHRGALHALYAFNIELSRVRDLAREPVPGEIRLQWWREVVEGQRDGEAQANPVAAALRDVAARYAIPVAALTGMIDAHVFDLYDEPMASMAAFEAQAERAGVSLLALTAGVLSRLAGEIDTLVRHAGLAHAATTALVSLGKHAACGQLYVPLDVLGRYGAEPADIFAGNISPEWRAVLAEMRLYARRHLAAAADTIAAAPDTVLPALLPLAVVKPTLMAMEESAYDPLAPRLLAPWRRQWLIFRAARRPRRIFE